MFSKKALENIKVFKSSNENKVDIDVLVDDLLFNNIKNNFFILSKKSIQLNIFKNLFKKKMVKLVLCGFVLFLLFFALWTSSSLPLYGDVGTDIIISLEPREVYNGESIYINVSIPDYYNISSLTADMGGKQTIDFVLINNESGYHIWSGKWIVHDMDFGNYFANIVGFDQHNIKYQASVDWKIIDRINSDLNVTNKTDVNNSINNFSNWSNPSDNSINDTINISISPQLDKNTNTDNISVEDDLNLSLSIEKSKYIINETIYIKGFISFNKSYINTSINLSIITPKTNIYDILNITGGIIEYEFVPNIEGIYVFNFFVNYKNKSLVKDVTVNVENLYLLNKKDEIENLSNIITIQQNGIINQAVKWTKEITFKNSKNQIEICTQNISLPSYAENITVFEKTGLNLNENLNIYYKRNNYIQINQTLEPNESKIFIINYTTLAPNSTEIIKSPYKKLVIVSSDFNYTNISAFTAINNIPRNKIHLYHRINNQRIKEEFTAIDLDKDSLIDRIEWIIPHLSTQTYEIIIEIIKAEHLDENRKYISEIYNETKSKDDIWSEPILNNEYVRVIFENELDNNKDITIYAKSGGTSQIEVYQMDNDTLITTFENITSENWYKIFLKNMSNNNTSFDLKTVGDFVEYDYIVDPTGWISPTGYNDPSSQWSTETKAYDGNTATYASHAGGAGWGGFLELNLGSAIYCNRVKVFSDFGYDIVDLVDIDIYNDTGWIDKYNGTIIDCSWTELTFSTETNVTAARFRYHYLSGGYQFWLYEFAFWQGQPLTLPSCLTKNATSIDETTAILHGNVTDDGGEPCQFRFEYGLDTSYGNYTSWRGSKVANEGFSEMISGLTLGNTYHYRAVIKNSFGQNNSTDYNFTTVVPGFGWISPTSNYDLDSKWDNETFSYDDDNNSYTRSYHIINDPNGQWGFFIYLNHSSIYCNSVRFNARGLTGDALQVDQADLDVRRGGIWVDVFNASFSDKQWIQCNFSQGIVDSVRIRFHINSNSGGLYFELYELDFNKSRPLVNITAESPTNQSTGISVTPLMNITVYNPNGNIMNITWYSNSSGTWQPFGFNLSVINGTYHQINNNFSSRGVRYWWYVSVNDGLDTNNSGIFHFTTNCETVLSNPRPSNNSIGPYITPICNVTVSDVDGGTVTVRFYENTTGAWILQQTNSSVDVTNPANVVWNKYDNASQLYKTYWWMVNVSDGKGYYTEEIYHFTTIEIVPPQVISNSSTGVEETNATLWGYLYSGGGESCTARFEYGTTTVYGTNTTNQTVSQAEEFSAEIYSLIPGQIYHYRAYADNSNGSDTGSDMIFLTKPQPPTSFNAQVNNSTTIYLTWTVGTGANKTYIERNTSSSWAFGEATEIYNGSAEFFEDSGLTQGITYFYQAWSYSTWTEISTFFKWSDTNASDNNNTNKIPTCTVINPINASASINLQPTCKIWANDTDDDLLTVKWYENTTGSWVLRQTNTSVPANSILNWTFTQANAYGKTYCWKLTISDSFVNTTFLYYFTTKPINTSVNTISPYIVNTSTLTITATNTTQVDNVTLYYRWSNDNITWSTPIPGMITDSMISEYEWDAQEGRQPVICRVNNSEYYLIATAGDTGSDNDGWAKVIRVYNNNGAIQQSVVSSYEFDDSDGNYPSIVHLPDTDKYAISYRDTTGDRVKVVTLQVSDVNGLITQSVIDSQSLTYDGLYTNMILVSPKEPLRSGWIFAIAYQEGGTDGAGATNDGFIETIWIDDTGMINNTIMSTREFDTDDCSYPHLFMVDANTVAICYTTSDSDGYVSTWNITSSGIIGTTMADGWEYDTSNGQYPGFIKISGNVFAVSYRDTDTYGYVKTFNITDSGMITKTFVDYLTFTESMVNNYNSIFPIVQGSVYGISFQGLNADGYINTMNISSNGIIGDAIIDSIEFDTADNAYFADVIYVNSSYYLVVYQGSGADGWVKTVRISNDLGWMKWENVSNPDNNSPWSWNFNFPNNTGYYEFYSIGKKSGSVDEIPPYTADTMCYFNPITSINVTPSQWDIGTTTIGNYNYSTSGYYFNLTNNGTVTLNIQIKASNAINATTGAQWNLSSNPGFNNFSLQYNKSLAGPWININQTYDTFVTNLGIGSWQTFDLKLIMATKSTTVDPLSMDLTFRSVKA